VVLAPDVIVSHAALLAAVHAHVLVVVTFAVPLLAAAAGAALVAPSANVHGVTVTAAVAVVDPTLLVAVSVYVVVAAGDTLRVPLVATDPMPWLMLTVVALVVVHVSVDAPPAVIEAGAALSVAEGTGLTVTVAVAVTEPAAFVAVNV
jgi:hypothetical protein